MIATGPGRTRLARLARRVGLDHNPLRRRTDRAETWIVAGLLAAFVIGAPAAAIAVGRAEHAAGVRALQAQQTWRRVPAVLLQSAPGDRYLVYQPPVAEWVRARWTAPDGSSHVGEVPVAAGKRAGSSVRVWVDGSGRVTGTPLTTAQVNSRTFAAMVFAPLGLAVLLLSIAVLTSRLLERRRLAGWEKAWASIESQWSGRG